jgi:alpha,alpha-trehalase
VKDQESLSYFKKAAQEMPELRLKVLPVPEIIDRKFLESLKGKHGLLTLDFGKPYVVPGGRFNEMYGWDSYFEALGLINDGKLILAKNMVDHFVYQITHYGKILNANRSYYLTRSQPPFLTSMIRRVYAELPRGEESRKWLRTSLKAAIKEYAEVWMGPDRLTETGLSRYFGNSIEISPEVEPGHYSHTLEPYAKKHGLTVEKFTKAYAEGKIKEPKLDEFFVHDQAVRESGHDTTYRWYVDGEDRCADFVTVDLNSLLYKTELDIALLIRDEFAGDFGLKVDFRNSNL